MKVKMLLGVALVGATIVACKTDNRLTATETTLDPVVVRMEDNTLEPAYVRNENGQLDRMAVRIPEDPYDRRIAAHGQRDIFAERRDREASSEIVVAGATGARDNTPIERIWAEELADLRLQAWSARLQDIESLAAADQIGADEQVLDPVSAKLSRARMHVRNLKEADGEEWRVYAIEVDDAFNALSTNYADRVAMIWGRESVVAH